MGRPTSSEHQAAHSSEPHRRAVVLVMCAGMFLVLLDVTAVNVTLPSIGRDLGASVSGLQWVVDGYAVAIASLLLAGGTVGDRIGHRRVVLAGLAVFGVASLLIGLASGTGVVIAGRVGQGVGAALLLPGTLAVISDTFPDRAEQAKAIGLWAGVSSLALPAGPLVGGALASLSWRAIFLVNIPVALAAAVAVLRLLPDRAGRQQRFDPLGVGGVTVTLGTGVFAVIELGHSGFGAPAIVAFVLCGGGLFGTVLAERAAPAPMLPPDLVRRPGFLGPNTVALTMNLVFNGTLFLTTLYLQDIRGYSPLAAGALVVPLAVPLVALAPVTSWLTAVRGPRFPVSLGCVLAAPGAAALVFIREDGSLLPLEVALVLLGIGAGFVTASVVAAAVRAVPAERSGFASGVNNAARQTGTALGVAVFGAVAGSPSGSTSFVDRLNLLGLVGGVLWLLAGLVAYATITRPRPDT